MNPYFERNNWYYTTLGNVRALSHFSVKQVPRSFWALFENGRIERIKTSRLLFGSTLPSNSSIF